MTAMHREMKPAVYRYQETNRGFELYLGEYSTLDGLSVFDESAELSIISLGATRYRKYGWATEKELPPVDSVGSLIELLEAEGDIGIVECDVFLPEYGTLSTHDDRECHYVMTSKRQCISVLNTVLPREHSNMLVYALLGSQGLYLSCSEAGNVTKYRSFDEYLSKNA
ncbi:hypothetical protein [Halopseudomonas salegens]|uniref:Uncharacterized protein n=1 Tax=Halopseudomonas salegens TaxID=1434072 RepID=A0A1H2F410_9GAMM|nr:hypothetical protein [Halopseudomonas salegens]SDU02092.1 hypothetical protein SAMN05216210_1269 [Halopseudomonas salegens]